MSDAAPIGLFDRALRRIAGARAAAVAETVRLRRRAVDKLGDAAAGWLFTDEALQQALAADPTTALTHRLRLSFSTEQLPDPNNRVTLGDEKDPLGIPRPKISYQIND